MVTIRNKADVVISTIIGRFLRKKKGLQTIFFNFSYNVSYQCLFENHKKG